MLVADLEIVQNVFFKYSLARGKNISLGVYRKKNEQTFILFI